MRKFRLAGQTQIPGVFKPRKEEFESGVPPPEEEEFAFMETVDVSTEVNSSMDEVASTLSDTEEQPVPDEEIPEPATAEVKQACSEVIKHDLVAEQNPGLTMELLLYRDRASKHLFRARLRWKGVHTPCVEHYCDTEEEALDWVYTNGEKELEEKHTPSSLKVLSGGIRFRSILRVLDRAHGDEVIARYFEEHPALVEALSKKPLLQLSEADFLKALSEHVGEGSRNQINEAIRNINTLMNMCQTHGIIRKYRRLHFLAETRDKFLRAMKNSLLPRVIPEDMSKQVYDYCCDTLLEQDYSLALLLKMTMGLENEEIAALNFCDIRGIFDADRNGEQWTMPPSGVLLIRVRRFYRKVTLDGKTKLMFSMAGDPSQYRIIPVPPHTEEPLRKYVVVKGELAQGNEPLIASRSEGQRVSPDALSREFQRVLKEAGLKSLSRPVFLPSKNGITPDRVEELAATTRMLYFTLMSQLEEVCKFQTHELYYFLARRPHATIDRHYWDPHTALAQLRMYGKLARWDLRYKENSAPGMEPRTAVFDGKQEISVFPPVGKFVESAHDMEAKPGASLTIRVKAKYGFRCRYMVIHSEVPE